jgi:hypothetical protein
MFPFEWLNPLHFLRICKQLAGEIIRADQRITALDVVGQVRQGAIAEGKLA